MINQLRQSQKRERWLLYLYVQSLTVDNRAEKKWLPCWVQMKKKKKTKEEKRERHEDVNSELHRHHDWLSILSAT